jgi:hypothetical protein
VSFGAAAVVEGPERESVDTFGGVIAEILGAPRVWCS